MTKTIFVGLCAFVLLCCSAVNAQVSEAEKAEGFVPMFNGKDLSEWDGNVDVWVAKDGCIVGQTTEDGKAKLTYNQFLTWKGGDVENFVFRADIKLSPKGNSGFQYRSQKSEKPYSVKGYQADFDGAHSHTGIMYGEDFGGILCQRGAESTIEKGRKSKKVRQIADGNTLRKELKVDDWNSYEITAKDFTFTHKINGHVMSITNDEDKDNRRKNGIFAIQAHVGPPMKVEIKNLRIKKITDGK